MGKKKPQLTNALLIQNQAPHPLDPLFPSVTYGRDPPHDPIPPHCQCLIMRQCLRRIEPIDHDCTCALADTLVVIGQQAVQGLV
jgi:hypothetical protein